MLVLNFRLEGKDNPSCDFADYGRFSTTLAEVLRVTHRALNTGEKQPRFQIVRLEIGSAVTAIADGTVGGQCISAFLETVEQIRSRQKPTLRLTGEEIRTYKQLANPLGHRTKSI